MIRVACLLAALLIAPLAHAEPQPGDLAPPVLSIAGKQIPLPQGNWVIAGQSSGSLTKGSNLGSFGTIWNLVLFRLSAGRPDAMAEVNINAMAVADGWGMAADCQRNDLSLTVVRSRSGWDAACFFIADSKQADPTQLPAAWRQAMRFAGQRGWVLPMQTITAGFRAANRRDVLDLRFHFTSYRIDESWRQARDRDLAAWSAMMIGCVEAGLKNRLPNRAVPAPGADESALELAGQAHRRQERLDYLAAARVISADDYTRQTSLLRQEAASRTTTDAGADEFYQLLSFQGLSVTSDALVTFLWTAQSVQAAALTVLQAGLRTGRSYLASYLWDQYGGPATRPDVARAVDFAYGRNVSP